MVVGFAGRAVAPAFAGVIVAAGLFAAQARAEETFHYDETNVRPAVYFAALSNLANAVMFPGLGEALIISPYERDEWLRHAGYVTRPAMPDMAAVGPLYAGAEPRFAGAPDFTVPRTLVWEQSSVDRTLDPSAQAWAMAKITSPEFHLQFHDLPDNKLAGLMMIPQARAQAQTLEKRLLNPAGLFAPLRTDGTFGEPSPRDQIAVLWAASNIILAGTSGRDDYWHAAYRDLTDPDSYRDLLRKAFAAVRKLPPQTPADRGLAIEALGRFALATGDDEEQANALRFAREHADALKQGEATEIEDIAFAIYGLTEAGRLLAEPGYGEAAAAVFRDRLLPRWDDVASLFRSGEEPMIYTPRLAGAVTAALGAMRWYGPEDLSSHANALFPRFFENAVIRSGLMQASPLPLVAKPYLENELPERFAHPALPQAERTGKVPVFASEVVYADGGWSVSDPTFRTGDALFLANMLAIRSDDGRTDVFLPDASLGELKR
ncbi:hypothetical protein [Hoeflea sp.]|uniref:hypothetical protein n=1 Tax=Hoeflea sp. TaxID=1940281 RepID=UPI003B526AE2